MKPIAAGCIPVLLILSVATLPVVVGVEQGYLSFHPEVGVGLIAEYLRGVFDGTSFRYVIEEEHLFRADVLNGYTGGFGEVLSKFFPFSAAMTLVCGMIALLIAIPAGMVMAAARGWVKHLFGFLTLIPDFAFALLLQLSVVLIYQRTGVLVAETATFGEDRAVLLPALTLLLLPLVYLVRQTSHQTRSILTEDYILTAKAKGLSHRLIHARHVFRNLLPFIRAELHYITSMLLGSLFVVEYLFNLEGMTRLLYLLGYQYPLLVNTLFSLAAIYLLTYGALQMTVFALERGLARD